MNKGMDNSFCLGCNTKIEGAIYCLKSYRQSDAEKSLVSLPSSNAALSSLTSPTRRVLVLSKSERGWPKTCLCTFWERPFYLVLHGVGAVEDKEKGNKLKATWSPLLAHFFVGLWRLTASRGQDSTGKSMKCICRVVRYRVAFNGDERWERLSCHFVDSVHRNRNRTHLNTQISRREKLF